MLNVTATRTVQRDLTKILGTVEGLDDLPFDSRLINDFQQQANWKAYTQTRALNVFMPSFRQQANESFSSASMTEWPAVSITGGKCVLQCDHCKGRILEPMMAVQHPQQLLQLVEGLVERGGEGLLLTGGSNRRNEIHYEPYFSVLEQIKHRFPEFTIAVHTGLATRQQAQAFASAGIDVVMMDVIGAQDTITQVYHLKRQVADFEQSLAWLCETGMRVVPHIVIGLHYGNLLGEWQALEIIKRHEVDALVLVVVMPHYADRRRPFRVPDVHASGRFFKDARQALPDTRIQLGCARPAGVQRLMLEVYAVLAGLNGIAYPGDEVLSLAGQLSIPVKLFARCCSSPIHAQNKNSIVDARQIKDLSATVPLSAFEQYPVKINNRQDAL